ncbi:hypothetical protein RJ55_06578 [Drechmeria coniospora]|nr:hypothetical protein RJ55_06578 [Drechmeria coniospora]
MSDSLFQTAMLNNAVAGPGDNSHHSLPLRSLAPPLLHLNFHTSPLPASSTTNFAGDTGAGLKSEWQQLMLENNAANSTPSLLDEARAHSNRHQHGSNISPRGSSIVASTTATATMSLQEASRVWDTTGYWAERQIAHPMTSTEAGSASSCQESPSSIIIKALKWRPLSAKPGSHFGARETSSSLPMEGVAKEARGIESASHQQPAPNPYLSEWAHVRSLQNPEYTKPSTESLVVHPRPNKRWMKGSAVPGSNETALRTTSTQAPLAQSANISQRTTKAWFTRAMKEFESKLIRHKNRREKRQRRSVISDAVISDVAAPQNTVDEVCKYLASQKNAGKTGTWAGDEKATKLSRKRFGKAPWQQNDSGSSFISVDSSVRDLLLGPTPPATPTSSHGPDRGRPDHDAYSDDEN